MSMLDDTSENYYDVMLENAMKKGEFRSGLTLQFVKKIMTFILYRYDEIFQFDKERFDFEGILGEFDSLVDFLRYGLGSDSLKQ